MDPTYKRLSHVYYSESINFYKSSKSWISIKNGAFICLLAIVTIILFTRFIDQLADEIWTTKGLLSLIPTSLIMSNKEIRAKYMIQQKL